MKRPIFFCTLLSLGLWGGNQTEDISPILSPDSLPYRVSISLADFQLPSDVTKSYGLQAFAFAVYDQKWLLLAGRTNGQHGFDFIPDNFPPSLQNTNVVVVDPIQKTVLSRSLSDPTSGLTQPQIDTLSVTTPQYYQVGETLYLVGGYGVDTATETFGTKSTLTAIDIPGLIGWVQGGKKSAVQSIRQTSHPLIQVAGGYLTQVSPHQPFLLAFGENYTGASVLSSDGVYTQQIRPFRIIDNGRELYVKPEKQFGANPSYRRTDLSVVPIMKKSLDTFVPGVVALSGVFTPDTGIWTVPILINKDGSSSMSNPFLPSTFKQGMNSFDCARVGLFSKEANQMYILLFGGISYLTESGGMFTPDPELPFVNSVTTIKIDGEGNFQQYLMEDEYPVILSEFSNPGNQLLFGTEARFIPVDQLPSFQNGVFSLDELGSAPVLLGYIVGGIQSTVANTFSTSDSSASPYIFTVYLERR